MPRLTKLFLLPGLLAVGVSQASAFSLMGPLATWMDQVKGYVDVLGVPTDLVGGPMNIGEEYRWNIPTITYGFSPAFSEFFGSNGIWQVEQAIQVLKDLPPASQIDLSKYPLSTSRVNYQASALLLTDLKSAALSYLLREIGMASPNLWVWSTRDHFDYTPPGGTVAIPYFFVVQRNFDPVTYQPSSYVNGILYTYSLAHATTPIHFGYAIPAPVDPLAPPAPSVVSADDADSVYGRYFTGLDRDTAGGLKYLYRSTLLHVENLATNVSGSIGGVTAGGNTAWSVVDTNTLAAGGLGPWGSVDVTNASTTNVTAGTTATNTPVATALRGGVEKITFQRVNFSSFLGTWVNITNRITDSFYTNGVIAHQVLQTVLTAPDIIFDARDLGFDSLNGIDVPHVRTISQATSWSNNGALTGTATAMDGPGVAQPGVSIVFTKVGRLYENIDVGTEASATPFFAWGSYDGTTNAPVAYPAGTSIRDLERQILGY
jgi:hypothetical protein